MEMLSDHAHHRGHQEKPMALINPMVAKRERLKLKLSLEELARRAGVNKATLHRIERGGMKRNAEHVVSRLAKAFGIDPDKLTDAQEPGGDPVETASSHRSQFNIRLSHEARNALALVAKRYRVKPLEVIEFAPLLFHIMASETLAERRRRLSQLRVAREQIEALQDNFSHIAERLLNDWQAEELELLEERSIATRDIRGELLDESQDTTDPRPYKYDDATQNPFIALLRDRLAAVQSSGGDETVYHWVDGMSPRYRICFDVALEYLGGDADAAEDLVEGRIAVHELPRELRSPGQEVRRAEWVRTRSAERAAENAKWLESLDLKDLGL
jgi:transcriptional regulator with XRE-family HTH domain